MYPCIYTYIYACIYTHMHTTRTSTCICVCLSAMILSKDKICLILTAIPMIFEGLFQAFQQSFSSKLVLNTVQSCFVAPNYYENGSSVSWLEQHIPLPGESGDCKMSSMMVHCVLLCVIKIILSLAARCSSDCQRQHNVFQTASGSTVDKSKL
jgi:hypothetical protein